MNPLEIMLEEMNKSGISCEITRKNKHGVLEPVKESEVKALTTKSQIATTANLLTRLTKEEKRYMIVAAYYLSKTSIKRRE